jgi:hypothetical protein
LPIFDKGAATLRVLSKNTAAFADRLRKYNSVIASGGIKIEHAHTPLKRQEFERLNWLSCFVAQKISNVSLGRGESASESG